MTTTNTKNNPYFVFEILDSGFLQQILTWGSLLIIVFFWLGFMTLSMLLTVLVKPVLLVNSNNSSLINHLISELAKFSFIDEKLELQKENESSDTL